MYPFFTRSLRFGSSLLLVMMSTIPLFSSGKVYLVLGSDTAIWEGMSVSHYHSHYTLQLYEDPTQNAYRVMDPAFRSRLVDSYGTPMKLTWWMMAGNIFRFADNTDVPLANTLTLYLMKAYHGAAVARWGDELSLHYHTFAWTDYDKDGIFYWNQSHSFEECRDDFDVTMAQFLLEENCYPVSFRSGWHYMDNGWQQYLNTLLPYSMDNDYPNKRFVTNEPIDNNFDWSLASKAWVPFRPSEANYQLPGGSGGWNVRSRHFSNITPAIMKDMFHEASIGTDQVACLWGHLPEPDFPDNLMKMDSLAHAAQAMYPGVTFRYCTAVEAMQRWRQSTDTTAPELTLTDDRNGESVIFTIHVNEPIFQQQPFVALKDVYERTRVLQCMKTAPGTWTAVCPLPLSGIVKVAAAVTDTMGNLATRSIAYLPNDAYIDNRDSTYRELRGTWTTTASTSWGVDARQAVLVDKDSVRSSWSHTITQTGRYNFFVQVPAVANAALHSTYRIRIGDQVLGEKIFSAMTPKTWVLIGTQSLTAGTQVAVECDVNGAGQGGRSAVSDVVKISALVRDRSIAVTQPLIDAGEIAELDTARVGMTLMNTGVSALTISAITASSSSLVLPPSTTTVIPAMSSTTIPLKIYSPLRGTITDTLRVSSNDPLQPVLLIPFTARIVSYFAIADNDDPLTYAETGSWSNSVATDCWGTTSRFTPILTTAHAVYTRTLPKSGIYEIQEYVPKTANASTRALYALAVNGAGVDTLIIDQNAGSGGWVTLFSKQLPAHQPVRIDLSDASTASANLVLRADAVRFTLTLETPVAGRTDAALPTAYRLGQNFPNPFNPSTTVRYALPVRSAVTLEVFNTLGQRVALLSSGTIEAGEYSAVWNASSASGLYLMRLHAQSTDAPSRTYNETRKMLLVR